MSNSALSIHGSPNELRATVSYAAALVHALGRDEAAGRRPARLIEPGMRTWERFRGRLNPADLVGLLFEDAAVLHPVPFDPDRVGGGLRLAALPAPIAGSWLRELADLDLAAPSADYLVEQARLLGLPTRMGRSDLHVVKAHHKVLELPGTGGQLGHHLALNNPDVTLHDNVTVACGSWQELTLAGIAALDLAAPHTRFAVRADHRELRDPEHPIRGRHFDFVVGLDPDKGGLFRVQDQLAPWFPGAKVLLV